MMLISSFVMESRFGKPQYFPFCRIGAAVSLIESDAGEKLFRTVLGKVMEKSLPVQPHLKAVAHHQELMFCNRNKMSYNINSLHGIFLNSVN